MIRREWRAEIMRKTSTSKGNGKKNRPKFKLGIPDLEHPKAAVLRSLGSHGADKEDGFAPTCPILNEGH
jgi:hypothetical protein